MKAESEKLILHLNKMNSGPQGELQTAYFEFIQKGQSIQEIIDFYLRQGWLVNFTELSNLMESLTRQNVIVNPSWQSIFNGKDLDASPTLPASHKGKPSRQELSRWPFFRSLPEAWCERFLARAQVLEMAAGTRFIATGSSERDLFVVLDGEARVDRVSKPGERLRLATAVPGSVLGEVAFLLGIPRTADVTMVRPGRILRIPFDPHEEALWRKDTAKAHQQRFWALQSLLKSPIFASLPEGTLEECLGHGEIESFDANVRLWNEGDPGSRFSVIIQGSVVFDQKGRNINVLGQGEGFGEISLFWGQGRRSAGARTQMETLLWTLDREAFYRLLTGNILLGRELERLAQERIVRDHRRSA